MAMILGCLPSDTGSIPVWGAAPRRVFVFDDVSRSGVSLHTSDARTLGPVVLAVRISRCLREGTGSIPVRGVVWVYMVIWFLEVCF